MTDEEIDRVIRQADAGWSVFAITQAALWLHNRDASIDWRKIEERLRAIGSKTTFLIAKSPASMPQGLTCRSFTNEPAQFWVWIGLNGPDEAMRELAREGKTAAQNLVDLASTGVLVKS